MRVNLAKLDRWIRGLIGFVLAAFFAAGGPTWAAFGFYLIFSASYGWCIFYAIFRIRTAKLTRFDLFHRS